MQLPRALEQAAAHDPLRADWLVTVPALVEQVSREWGLTLREPYQPGGQCSWVAPTSDGQVLKLGWVHPESLHEPEGLRAWDGDGAVRLLRHEQWGDTHAMLLERCDPGTSLRQALSEPEQDPIIAGLLQRLWRPAGPPFRPLSELCDLWADDASPGDPMTSEAVGLLRELSRDASAQVLLVTDLHSNNVLASTREPWLVIDPKPYVGDPHFDVLQHLLNSPSRLHDDPHDLVRRMAGLLDLDAGRLRLWLFARCVIECVLESTADPALLDVARRLRP